MAKKGKKKTGGQKKKAATPAPAPAPAPAPSPKSAPAEEVEDDDEPEAEKVAKGEQGKHAKDLDSVTDRVEEEGVADDATMNQALSNLSGQSKAQVDEDEIARKKAMAKLKLVETDVALIMNEFLLDKGEAEKALRENMGNADDTITYLLDR